MHNRNLIIILLAVLVVISAMTYVVEYGGAPQ
jgi:hypothetical protein